MSSGFGGTADELRARQEAERRNFAVRNAGIGVSGASVAPAPAQNPHFPARAPVANMYSPIGATTLPARPPVAPPGGAPGVRPPTWAAVPPNGTGLTPGGRAGPGLSGVPPRAPANGNAALGFGGGEQRTGAATNPQGVGGGVNARVGEALGQGAHLELEMLRLEKERERLLLEQEVEMLRLENEIRERGMQLMQRETVLGGANATSPLAAALCADAAGDAGPGGSRMPPLLNNLIDGGGSGISPQAAVGNSRAVPRQSEVIELGDSSDEDEGKGKDSESVQQSDTRTRQPNRSDQGTGDSSLTSGSSAQHSQVRNATTEKASNSHAAPRRNEAGTSAERLIGQGAESNMTNSSPNSNIRDNEVLEKVSSKKRSGENLSESSAVGPNEDDDKLPIQHAHKKRKMEMKQAGGTKDQETAIGVRSLRGGNVGGDTSISGQSSDQCEPQRDQKQTGTPPTQGGVHLIANVESDDDSVVIVAETTLNAKVSKRTSGESELADRKNSSEQLGAVKLATAGNNAESHGGGHANTATEVLRTQPEAGGMARRGEELQQRLARGSSEKTPVPADAALPSTETAIDEHCATLQRGINQLHERMARLEKYATSMKGGKDDALPVDQKHTAQRIEELKEENQHLREKAQKASNYWKEKCQEKELHYRRVFTEMEGRFKKNMSVLQEKQLKDFERERESHRDVLEARIDDEPVAQKEELERRIASTTLETQALSNAAEKLEIYGKRELEALTKRLEAERVSEREFYRQQKEEIIIRMKRAGREERYFREKAMGGAGRDGPRSQSSRPLPSDVLGDNMIYLLMRDLANLEYMADFLRKKMKQDMETGEVVLDQYC